MNRNTDFNIIDDSFDCNQSAVESAAVRTTNAERVSLLPGENVGSLTAQYLRNQTDRSNGQAKI